MTKNTTNGLNITRERMIQLLKTMVGAILRTSMAQGMHQDVGRITELDRQALCEASAELVIGAVKSL